MFDGLEILFKIMIGLIVLLIVALAFIGINILTPQPHDRK